MNIEQTIEKLKKEAKNNIQYNTETNRYFDPNKEIWTTKKRAVRGYIIDIIDKYL